MVDRIQIKQEMPRGLGKKVAKKIGVTPKSVSNYLTGKTNSERIEMAILETLADLKREKKRLLKTVCEPYE